MKSVAVIETKFVLVLLLLAFAQTSGAAEPAGKISFNNQIQPILSEYCYPCHGPDSATRKPKKNPMRLDREQFAFEPRVEGKPVIIRGDPKASELVRRIKATDDDVMPPASEHKSLKAEQIVLLEKWVAQGAKYEKHWSLIPPARPRAPPSANGWGKNPIDQFVAYKLKENGLKPNPEEQKARLLRRLSFDLTGLPPSTKELQEFLNDKSPKAYENAVDRMLASDASSEQFARHWLDAVRYADTQGIHHDHSRSIWPYRDWVIASFKANLSFDEFTIEQVAGDLLPNATTEQKIASGYNRLLPTTGEGGAIADEYAAIYAKDRTETTAAVWLGLTAGCATCHDHKFDPITSKDFYSMTAFFRNSTIPILDNGENANTPPVLFVPKKEDQSKWTALEQAMTEKKQAIENRKREAKADFEKWIANPPPHPSEESNEDQPALHLLMSEAEGPLHGSAQGKQIEWVGGTERHPGPFGPAPLIGGGNVLEAEGTTFSRRARATFGAFIYVEAKPSGAVFSRMNKAEGYRGWDLLLTSGKPTVHVIDRWPGAALKVTSKETLKADRWHHVMAVFDGTRKGADALGLYIDGRKVDVEVNNNDLGPQIVPTNAPFRFGGRSDGHEVADAISGNVFLQDFRFYKRALTAAEVGRLAVAGLARDFITRPADQRGAEETNRIYELYLAGFDPPSQKLEAELAQLNSEGDPIRKRGATTLIMEEKKDSEPIAHVLLRGQYANKGAQVSAATPSGLPPMNPELPRNRLGLARWMMSRDNPLTARVTVNRLWSYLFGLGIVETTEDFGVMGARPSNQDLLDWLGVEFMDSGWDLRHIVKLMVMSATYRQSEAVSAIKLEKDPLNKLCSRSPHIRLDAEEIRDQALAASGLLVQKLGGPPVKPYQPEGVWEAVAMKVSNTRVYMQDKGEGLYRRSLYTFWKRIAPPANLEILNAPSREVFCTRRERTDTPLQAFVTMNDPQFVEAARQLAGRAVQSTQDFDSRLDRITEPLLARRLTTKERATVRKLQEHALKNYQTDLTAAQSLVTVGESEPDKKLPPAELAAWTLVASEVMNLDESLTK
jgi:hypothetical protein